MCAINSSTTHTNSSVYPDCEGGVRELALNTDKRMTKYLFIFFAMMGAVSSVAMLRQGVCMLSESTLFGALLIGFALLLLLTAYISARIVVLADKEDDHPLF